MEERELHNALEKLSFNWDRQSKGRKKGVSGGEKKKGGFRIGRSKSESSFKKTGSNAFEKSPTSSFSRELVFNPPPEVPTTPKPRRKNQLVEPKFGKSEAQGSSTESSPISPQEERKLTLFTEACADSLWNRDDIEEFNSLLLEMDNTELIEWQTRGIANCQQQVGYELATCTFSKMCVDFHCEKGRAPNYEQMTDVVNIFCESRKTLEFTVKKEEIHSNKYVLNIDPPKGEVKKNSNAVIRFQIMLNNGQECNIVVVVRVASSYTYYLKLTLSSPPTTFGAEPSTIALMHDNGYKIPRVLAKLRERFEERNCVNAEGIFRKAADRKMLIRDKKSVQAEEFSDVYDVHVIANLIKAYYRELPTLILENVPIESIEGVEDQMEAVAIVKKHVHGLLHEILWWIIDLAADVAVNIEKNQMGAKSLANVIAPNLLLVEVDDQLETMLRTQRLVDFVYMLICHSLFNRHEEKTSVGVLQSHRRKMNVVGKGKPLMTIEELESMEWKQSDQTYDMIVCIDSISEVIPPNKGWKVKFLPGMEFLLKGEKDSRWTSSVVSVMGLYNKGKTYVLNQIANLKLKSGTTIHTEGISFKVVQNKHARHILLDTAGLHSPVKFSHESTEEILALRSASEFFLQDLTFILSDFFIIVLNDLTSLDQEYLLRLQHKLRDFPEKVQQVYVLHNFIGAKNEKELNDLWQDQVVRAYGKFGQLIDEYVYAKDSTNKVSEFNVSWINTPNSRHLHLANGNTEFGEAHNPPVIALLKQWIGTMFIPVNRSFSPMHLILKHANTMLHYYIVNMGELEFHHHDRSIVMKVEPGEPAPSARPAIIDEKGFTFVDADFIPKCDIFSDSEGLYILLDAPGLTNGYSIHRRGFDTLVIEGGRMKPKNTSVMFHYGMRKYGKFKKELRLPSGYNVFKCRHSISDDGVIQVFVPLQDTYEVIKPLGKGEEFPKRFI